MIYVICKNCGSKTRLCRPVAKGPILMGNKCPRCGHKFFRNHLEQPEKPESSPPEKQVIHPPKKQKKKPVIPPPKKKKRFPWNKGKHGVYSEETLQKMRGRVPWNKGKTGIYSSETIQRMRDANRNRPPREHLTEDQKRKISEGLRRYYSGTKEPEEEKTL